jgi:rhodanese-related sulfurtransferase
MENNIEVLPRQAWELLARQPKTRLVDVRTDTEWRYVGEPSLKTSGGTVVKLSWHLSPDMKENPNFLSQLRASVEPDSILFFICRSGGRGLAAANAARAAGFVCSYSIVGGFEGAVDEYGHRGMVAGWKHEGLPWVQT